jgi:DNA-binding NarL/FixJ family response regulator
VVPRERCAFTLRVRHNLWGNVSKSTRKKIADVGAMLRVARSASPPTASAVDPAVERRQLVADMCRLLGQRINGQLPRQPGNGSATNNDTNQPAAPPLPRELPDLSPRMRQTLEQLLAGDSEKQIAQRLGLSRHTVHVYVKALYKGFSVSSRGELLALFISPTNVAKLSPSR